VGRTIPDSTSSLLTFRVNLFRCFVCWMLLSPTFSPSLVLFVTSREINVVVFASLPLAPPPRYTCSRKPYSSLMTPFAVFLPLFFFRSRFRRKWTAYPHPFPSLFPTIRVQYLLRAAVCPVWTELVVSAGLVAPGSDGSSMHFGAPVEALRDPSFLRILFILVYLCASLLRIPGGLESSF